MAYIYHSGQCLDCELLLIDTPMSLRDTVSTVLFVSLRSLRQTNCVLDRIQRSVGVSGSSQRRKRNLEDIKD